ncbi:RNA polymerase sigma factor [Chitinimonas sp.]|uniref:RNA polymerase sigma factor n=1 Tax=Chitinimonas sp. TaxID=1934313 RepID=UPI0035B4BA2F
MTALVLRMADGDEAALGELYDASISRVYAVALHILGQAQDAEDVASRVYMQAWQTAAEFDLRRGSVLAWLLVICRSRAIDLLRSRESAELCEDIVAVADSVWQTAHCPAGLLEINQHRSALAKAMAALTIEQRDLIALAFNRGMTHQEIAQIRRQPLGTVKSGIRRALASMKPELILAGIDIGPEWTGLES